MLIFIFKLTIAWASFALIYSLLLRQETFFRANRAYLLTAAATGVLLPCLPEISFLKSPAIGQAIQLPEVFANLENAGAFSGGDISVSLFGALAVLYGLGFVFSASRFGAGLAEIRKFKKQGQPERLPNGLTLVRHPEIALPFSFFRQVFVSPDFGDRPGDREMLAHEIAHAKGWHSADVVFLEILGIVFWFHPLVFWFRRATRSVHEFLADAETARLSNKKQYGLLLIRQTQSGPALALANHFFTSQLKKRIVMLTKKASSPARSGWKYALVLPLLPLFVLLFQQNTAFAQSKPSQTAAAAEVDVLPEFEGGMEALMKFLGTNIQYPEDARNAGGQGKVVLKFIVDTDGRVTEVQEADFKGEKRFDSMIRESIRVASLMPNWKPAQKGGKPVKCVMHLPVMFKL